MDEAGRKFKLIATTKCPTGTCPTVLETDSGDELVIVGKLDEIIAKAASVQQHIGEGETAVIIPKSLLLEAAKLLV
jgi:hypothetical protein